jgi:predicted Fe-Mo cluster-binding NifX family protein
MVIDGDILEEAANYAYDEVGATKTTRVTLDEEENEKYLAIQRILSDALKEQKIDNDTTIKIIIKTTAKYGEKAKEYIDDAMEILKIARENEIEDILEQAIEYRTMKIEENHFEILDVSGESPYPESGIFELVLAHAMKPGHSGRTDYLSANGGWGYVFGRTESGEVFLFKTYAKIQYVLDFFSNPDIPEEIKNAILEQGIEI